MSFSYTPAIYPAVDTLALTGVSSDLLERGKELFLPCRAERNPTFTVSRTLDFARLLRLSEGDMCLAHAYNMSTYSSEFLRARSSDRPWICDFSGETIPTTAHMLRKYGRVFHLRNMTREFVREALEERKSGKRMDDQQLLEMQYTKSGALEFLHYMKRVASLWERGIYQEVLGIR